MALRTYMLMLPCVALLSMYAPMHAEDAAEAQEQQEEQVTLNDMLDDDQRAQLQDLQNDVQALVVQVKEQLESKHSDIIEVVKDILGSDNIPCNLQIPLGKQLEEDAEAEPSSAE